MNRHEENQLDILAFPGVKQSRKAAMEKGWDGQDCSEFFKGQLSSLAFQLASLENHIISNPSAGPDLERGYSFQQDPVRRTRQMLKQMQHARRVLELAQAFDREIQPTQFDLETLVLEVWENNCSYDQTLDRATPGELFVLADRDQFYVAIACLMNELSEDSSELSISKVKKNGAWEMEIADNCEKLDANSLAIRTAEMVAKNHFGKFEILNCPQGGNAFNFVLPSESMKQAA